MIETPILMVGGSLDGITLRDCFGGNRRVLLMPVLDDHTHKILRTEKYMRETFLFTEDCAVSCAVFFENG